MHGEHSVENLRGNKIVVCAYQLDANNGRLKPGDYEKDQSVEDVQNAQALVIDGGHPNGSRVGTPSCWFNPNAFALPPPGKFGNAGRNILRGPGFAQFDLALQKGFELREGIKITLGVEAYNLFNHPNFAVPSNTQSPLTLGGNGDAVFQDAAGNLAKNVGRIFTTVGTGRQIQLDARFTF